VSALVVGIAGGTGSGKTTVARTIAEALPKESVATLEFDAYYRDRPDLAPEARALLNFDHPDALEIELLVDHLRALRAGEPALVPRYDFKRHRREDEPRRLASAPIIVV
jgi:uridine kinase